MTLRIDKMTVYQLYAVVYGGHELDAGPVEIPNPVMMAEGLSLSTS
jgi:hypothetical protein